MTYNVITPFSRWGNLIELGDCLKRQGVTWHLLMVKGEPVVPSLGSWVHTHYFDPPPESFFIGHWLCNRFLDEAEIDENSRVHVLTDDDAVEEGFYRKLDQYDDDVLVTSMLRSNKPEGGAECPFGTLIAAPENIKVSHVGYEQILPKAKIARQYRCASHYEADGDLIVKMFSDHMEGFRFVPDAYVKFDALPPGAWKCARWNR